MAELPRPLQEFISKFPDVWKIHEDLRAKCESLGPLEKKTQHLIKIGIAAGARLETPVKRHTLIALEDGVTEDEIFHAILLVMATVGFPTMIAALTWAKEAIQGKR